jgi:hypothetical protein
MKYKVGDRVRINSLDWYNENKDEYGYINCGSRAFFTKMSDLCGKIATVKDVCKGNCYCLEEYDFDWTDEMIEGLAKEEEIEFTEEDKYWCDIMSESDPTTYVLPQGYQFKDENGNVINAQKIVLEKKKKEYPKTYEECLSVLEIKGYDIVTYVPSWTAYEKALYQKVIKLRELIICRGAYWKIAGEEMGLGKPWEPDWNTSEPKYVIACTSNGIEKQWETTYCKVFAFPTEEMRDAFYENFKSEIESCKEFL